MQGTCGGSAARDDVPTLGKGIKVTRQKPEYDLNKNLASPALPSRGRIPVERPPTRPGAITMATRAVVDGNDVSRVWPPVANANSRSEIISNMSLTKNPANKYTVTIQSQSKPSLITPPVSKPSLMTWPPHRYSPMTQPLDKSSLITRPPDKSSAVRQPPGTHSLRSRPPDMLGRDSEKRSEYNIVIRSVCASIRPAGGAAERRCRAAAMHSHDSLYGIEELSRDDSPATRWRSGSVARDDSPATRWRSDSVARDDSPATRWRSGSVARDDSPATRWRSDSVARDDSPATRWRSDSVARDDSPATRRRMDSATQLLDLSTMSRSEPNLSTESTETLLEDMKIFALLETIQSEPNLADATVVPPTLTAHTHNQSQPLPTVYRHGHQVGLLETDIDAVSRSVVSLEEIYKSEPDLSQRAPLTTALLGGRRVRQAGGGGARALCIVKETHL
ncbi:PREDICTED: uncharacterized protein LOC106818881 [Priapulus caudatus]|uniref:Uncharacterized protein LOC106818881 n=1 Tax=Priapulus caudatus TaxID=37621 RepID=A0ABM1F3L5_PRICU|nr:PREDICTED: uncharacterized protein LOC106818881 [Priapulus caudatus]